MNLSLTYRLAIALAIGLIIGMERGWQSRESLPGSRVAGFRSFAFVGLFGGITALLAAKFGGIILAINFLGLTAIVSIAYGLSFKTSGDLGITTELALLITFMLGALSGSGYEAEAIGVAVVMALLLGLKQELHQTLKWLDRRELIATLQLLILAAVVLPLLPDQNLGPWEALNPRAIGFLILLIAGISYIGYFAMRLFGAKTGLLATAVLGGLVSSTAVTLSFSRMARTAQTNMALLGAGISLAAGTMAVRILLEVAVVNSALLRLLVLPLALLAITPLVAALAIAFRQKATASTTALELRNPVELGTALGFGAMLSLILVLVRAFEVWFGNAGIYALSAISGITDVDAVSLSLAQSTRANLPLSVGATGILIAAMVNTLVKATLATAIGGWKLAKWCASILLTALGFSVIAALLTWDL
jgi:uncharacterized membrane protein (DUF4010 family)